MVAPVTPALALEHPMSSNVWSDRSLGGKLSALVGVGAVSMAVFALITVQALQGTGETAEELLASALRAARG
jgi:hypothetical protein